MLAFRRESSSSSLDLPTRPHPLPLSSNQAFNLYLLRAGWGSPLQSWRKGAEVREGHGECALGLSSVGPHLGISLEATPRVLASSGLRLLGGATAHSQLPSGERRHERRGGESRGARVAGNPSGAREIPAATRGRATALVGPRLPARPQLCGALRQQRPGWSCLPAAARCWTRLLTAAP